MKATTQNWRTVGGQLPGSVPRSLAECSFRQGDVPAARQFTRAFGARAQLEPARLADLVLAVSEAMAAATARGPCTVRVRLWMTGSRAFCEVRGDGYLERRTAQGERQGEAEALRGWILQRLTDYVSVASGPDGTRVLLSMTVS